MLLSIPALTCVASFKDFTPVYGADLAQEDICAIRYETGNEDFELHKCYFDIEAVQFHRDDPAKG